MLVLSRKVLERILIGDKVVVTVVRIGPNAVRLGIEAPKDMNIVREELVGHAIQVSELAISDLGCRLLDPLGVAECYEELSQK